MGAPAYAHVYTHTFSRTHSLVFLSDNLRNTLREVIRENGLSLHKLMQDWETIERGIRKRLHLSDCSLHRSWGAASLRLCGLCIPLYGTARSTPGWNGHCHRPHDGWRDVLEVAHC